MHQFASQRMTANADEILVLSNKGQGFDDAAIDEQCDIAPVMDENCNALKQPTIDPAPPSTSSTSSSSTSSSLSGPSGSSSFDQDRKSNDSCPFENHSKNQNSGHSYTETSQATKVTENAPGEQPTNGCYDNKSHQKEIQKNIETPICYNPALDDEIRARLDKLNALSDLINSLELKFDHANALFREILKCSTERLSSIAKTLGSKSIRQGRIYHAAKITVEQTQSDCQRACVQFERANNDHQSAKDAIKEAELKLREVGTVSKNGFHPQATTTSLESIDLGSLKLNNDLKPNRSDNSKNECDNHSTNSAKAINLSQPPVTISSEAIAESSCDSGDCEKVSPDDISDTAGRLGTVIQYEQLAQGKNGGENVDDQTEKFIYSAKLSEDLNKAITKLIDAEQKRRQSEKLHLDQANKLMIAQENLTRMEREHGTSIRRAQVYFEEAKQFNARLNSVKSDIARISEEILAAKQAYARTLSELEQFSEDLHIISNNSLGSRKDGS